MFQQLTYKTATNEEEITKRTFSLLVSVLQLQLSHVSLQDAAVCEEVAAGFAHWTATQ